jgi:hypothetical protein
MRNLYILFAILLLFVNAKAQHSNNFIGDTTKLPDLYVLECDRSYNEPGTSQDCIGLYQNTPLKAVKGIAGSNASKYYVSVGDTILKYSIVCYIGNAAQYQLNKSKYLQNDLVINTLYSAYSNYPDYVFPDLIYNKMYDWNGNFFGGYIKDNYNLGSTIGTYPKLADSMYCHYGSDKMKIWCQWADSYRNPVWMKCTNGHVPNGFYCVVVEVNPLRLIRESNYNNNIGVLPIKVVNDSVMFNDSALIVCKSSAINTLVGSVTWGNKKYVELAWESNGESFDIYKDNLFIGTTTSNYFKDSNLRTGFKSARYTVISKTKGLRNSSPVTKEVIR